MRTTSRVMRTGLSLTLVGLLAGVTSCKSTPASAPAAGATDGPAVGRACVVQFRRDFLGAHRDLPVSPLTSSINGASTAVSGTLRKLTADWVVVETEQQEVWVPRSVVLALLFDRKQ